MIFQPRIVVDLNDDSRLNQLRRMLPKSAFPVGTTGGHQVFIFVDLSGTFHLVHFEGRLVGRLATSASEAVEILCGGRNGRVDADVYDHEGVSTGDVITADNERSFWNVEAFPNTANFLPPVSLSPLRYPPTWRAIVPGVENTLAKCRAIDPGAVPAQIKGTPGGITSGRNGQKFWATHCENSIYFRNQAGIQLSSEPYPGSEPGQMFPVRNKLS